MFGWLSGLVSRGFLLPCLVGFSVGLGGFNFSLGLGGVCCLVLGWVNFVAGGWCGWVSLGGVGVWLSGLVNSLLLLASVGNLGGLWVGGLVCSTLAWLSRRLLSLLLSESTTILRGWGVVFSASAWLGRVLVVCSALAWLSW